MWIKIGEYLRLKGLESANDMLIKNNEKLKKEILEIKESWHKCDEHCEGCKHRIVAQSYSKFDSSIKYTTCVCALDRTCKDYEEEKDNAGVDL